MRETWDRALVAAAAWGCVVWTAGCAPGGSPDGSVAGASEALEGASAGDTSEPFDGASKTSYATGAVTLASGVWTLDDALLGRAASDAKNGAASARLRASGRLTMGFDRAGGVKRVTLAHAAYGADPDGTWELYASQDHGARWTRIGGPITSHGGPLATATFDVDLAGPVRFELRKTDGGSNRIDVDDFTLTGDGDSSGSAGTPEGPPPSTRPRGADVSVHTALGLPAAASTDDWSHYLSVKSGYVLSYDSHRKIPNWVSWRLDQSDFGGVKRSNAFRTDDSLPAGMPQATLADFVQSGYDRGHMCPSDDRTSSASANAQTFLLTNMVPQAHDNNAGPWEKLESYARSLVSAGNELYVVSGGIEGDAARTIGDGVTVPSATFKVIAVLAQPSGPEGVTRDTRVIGVMVPNDDARVSLRDDWKAYRVSVRAIEAASGLDFLSDVDAAVQDDIESRVDTN